MNIGELIKEYSVSGCVLIVIFFTFVEIAPIKINPWSKIASFIGKALFSSTKEEISKEISELKRDLSSATNEVNIIKNNVQTLDGKINSMDYQIERDRAIEARRSILRFGDEVSHGCNHSRDHFQQIITSDISFYNQYCHNHPEFRNDMTKVTSERIIEDYKARDKDNSFL